MAQWYTFVYFSEIRAYRVAIHEEFDWDLVEMRYFIVQPSKFCLVIFGANFAWLFVLYQGGVIGPMPQ